MTDMKQAAKDAKLAKSMVKKAQQRKHGWVFLLDNHDRLSDGEQKALDKELFAVTGLTYEDLMVEVGLKKKPVKLMITAEPFDKPLDELRVNENGTPKEPSFKPEEPVENVVPSETNDMASKELVHVPGCGRTHGTPKEPSFKPEEPVENVVHPDPNELMDEEVEIVLKDVDDDLKEELPDLNKIRDESKVYDPSARPPFKVDIFMPEGTHVHFEF